MTRDIPPRLQWFLDRVNKRIYRNPTSCTCGVCKNVTEHGLIVNDSFHAEYLYDCEGESTAEGTPLRYFDSKDEVREWLASKNSTTL